MKLWVVAAIGLFVVGCAGVTPPLGQENVREFSQVSAVQYQDAYRIIAKQMRACFRVIGLFGNGYDVHADLDVSGRKGYVELYPVGLAGAQRPEDSIYSRTVEVLGTPSGSIITTNGMTSKYVYATHRLISSWLSGIDTCSAE